jgi:hypothetical protein
MVYVRVCVNVDSLRIGYEGDVELTPRIQKLVSAGYLQILGHVWVPPEPEPPTMAPATVASPTRTRAPRKVADNGAAGADPA